MQEKRALLRRVASSSLFSPQDRSGRLDRALSALRTLHDEYGPALRRVREARELHVACGAATFAPGTVIKHARFKYRGVVYGWDPVCERDAVWCAAAGVRPDQPFYYVLPDEGDSLRLLGGVRISKYVAHENVVPFSRAASASGQPPPNRLKHRALDHYFEGYSARQGAYVPNKRLRYEVRGPAQRRLAGEDPKWGRERGFCPVLLACRSKVPPKANARCSTRSSSAVSRRVQQCA